MKHWIHEEGNKGQEVRRLQDALGITADGDFGPMTKKAVEQYQSDSGLSVDGRVGPQTRENLGIQIYPGLDISSHQGKVDWNGVVSSGVVDYCWIKVTEGNTHVQKTIKEYFDGAKKVGIPTGGYHFARADLHKDPTKEVENFAKNCPVESGGLKPVLDFEVSDNHDKDSAHAWVLEFVQQAEKKLGVPLVIYTGANMIRYSLFNKTDGFDHCPLWIPAYSKKVFSKGIPKKNYDNWKEWTIWQWTDQERIPGVNTKVDRNWLVGGPAGLKKIMVD
tara:strand:+ start:1752 stop:2579 length:828 start_codon:yes stop_codon:yes gene_type:complete